MKLFRNDVGTLNAWLAIRLRGAGGPGHANRSAIGARVSVTAGGVTQTREVQAGGGHEGPMRPLTLTFGLGDATLADEITIRWPNAERTVQTLTAVAVNQFLTVDEPCEPPVDPTGLLVERHGADLLLIWDDPAREEWVYNVYRDATPDPAGWGPPHAEAVSDEDPARPGIQYTDAGAADPSSGTFFYVVTATDVCGESPLF